MPQIGVTNMATTSIILSTQALDGTLIPSKISTNPSDIFVFPSDVTLTAGNLTFVNPNNLVRFDSDRFIAGNTGPTLQINNNNVAGTLQLSTAGVNTWIFAADASLTTPGAVGIGVAPGVSAMLQVNSTTRGFLPPRMTTTQRNAIATPATGLQLFNTTLGVPEFYNGTTWSTIGSGSTDWVDNVFTAPSTGPNQVFVLTQTPIVPSIIVTHNGLVLRPTTDYTLSGTNLTIVEVVATGENIQATYAVSNNSGSLVSSINGLTGNITLAAGANITITPAGNTLTIAATGSLTANIVTVTAASYAVLATDYTVLGNATSNVINITLPLASAGSGRILNFKKTDVSANNVNVNRAGSDLLDGQTSIPLTTQYQSVTIQSDGTNWNIL